MARRVKGRPSGSLSSNHGRILKKVISLKRNLLINGGFILALAILSVIGWLNYLNIQGMTREEQQEHHTYAESREFDELLSALHDMEMGERGFVFTGKESYLESYHAAPGKINVGLARLRALIAADHRHNDHLAVIEPLIRERLALSGKIVELRRTAGLQKAQQAARTEKGAELMDEIRRRMSMARSEEEQFLSELNDAEHASIRRALLAIIAGSTVSFSLLIMVFLLLRREITRRGVIEEELRTHRDHLEELVQKRTLLLEQAKYEAEIGNRTKSEFLTNMSHEMRTPLTGILGIIDMLLAHGLTEEQRYFLKMAKTSADSLNQLINDILELSQIEAGEVCFLMQSFNIRDCIRLATDIFKMEIEHKGLGFTLDIDDRVPEKVVGDAVRLRQVLINLVGNSVKFTERGEIAISVRPGHDALQFVVRDTGIGIAAGNLENIFEKFTQADVSLTRKYSGAGLGLALAKRIVENIGGEIHVESRPGEGSTFAFTIPLVKTALSP